MKQALLFLAVALLLLALATTLDARAIEQDGVALDGQRRRRLIKTVKASSRLRRREPDIEVDDCTTSEGNARVRDDQRDWKPGGPFSGRPSDRKVKRGDSSESRKLEILVPGLDLQDPKLACDGTLSVSTLRDDSVSVEPGDCIIRQEDPDPSLLEKPDQGQDK